MGICDRPEEVRDAIVAKISGVSDCGSGHGHAPGRDQRAALTVSFPDLTSLATRAISPASPACKLLSLGGNGRN